MVISIGELQKNISLLKNLKEPLIVIDRRTNKEVAFIQPIGQSDEEILQELLVKEVKKRKDVKDVDSAFEEVYTQELKRKYGTH